LKGLGAGVLALAAGRLALDEAGAKRQKKCKKRKKGKGRRCVTKFLDDRARLVCTDNNSAGGFCPTECCLHILEPVGGDTVCRPPGYVCCAAEDGGGACDPDHPFCCAPTEEEPEGFCSMTGAGCEETLRIAFAEGISQRAARIGRRT
jgi:hypothetical protein